MRIGVFGGTFDPPTVAHLQAARTFIERLKLDEVWLIPAKQNPLKHSACCSPSHRLNMVAELIQGEAKLCVTDIEAHGPFPSYTYNTLKALDYTIKAEYWVLGGSDILTHFAQWHQVEKLMKLCRLGILLRPPDTMNAIKSRIPEAFRSQVDIFEDGGGIDMSSTEVRTLLEQGRSVSHLLKSSVLDYIKEYELYIRVQDFNPHS